MKRIFDLVVSLLLIGLLGFPMLLIGFLVRLTSNGPALYWSNRVGIGNVIFKMPKFRTMYSHTPPLATHLLKNADSYTTPVGRLLRKLSLDELPQLLSVVRGDMSLVGPRPSLFNQHDLISLRTERGIHRIVPGITGWAQVNGRDDLPLPVKVEYDEFYVKNRSFWLDLKILGMTFIKTAKSEGVSH